MAEDAANKPIGQARENPAPKPEHHANPIERLAETVEAHLIEGAELATATTSAETNVLLAALGVIEGSHQSDRDSKEAQASTEQNPNADKPGETRPETR